MTKFFVYLLIAGVATLAAPRAAQAAAASTVTIAAPDSAQNNTFKAGDTISITVNFTGGNVDLSQNVRVYLYVGPNGTFTGLSGTQRWAAGPGAVGSGHAVVSDPDGVNQDSITFEYTVGNRDLDTDGIQIRAGTDGFHNGNRLLDTGTSTAVTLTNFAGYNSDGSLATAYKVDGVRPQLATTTDPTMPGSGAIISTASKMADTHLFWVYYDSIDNKSQYAAGEIVAYDATKKRKAYFYGAGETIEAQLAFNEPVKFGTNANPVWKIDLDGDQRVMTAPSGLPAAMLKPTYVVGSGGTTGDLDGDFDLHPQIRLTYTAGGLTDAVGNSLWSDTNTGLNFSPGHDFWDPNTNAHRAYHKHGVDTISATTQILDVPTEPQTGAFDVTISFHNANYGFGDWIFAEFHDHTNAEFIEGFKTKFSAGISNAEVTNLVYAGVKMSDDGVSAGRGGGSTAADTHEVPWYTRYTATITPTSGGDITLKVPANAVMDIAGNGNLESNMVTMSGTATLLGVPTETTLALPSVALPAKGFVVLAHEGASVSNTGLAKRFYSIARLPNLETFFTGNGGTLELVHTGAATAAAKVVGPIITEIMWGTDLSIEAPGEPKLSQWIEIYNAGAAEIQLSNYQLKVTPFSSDTFAADAKAVDTVGNLGDGRWNVPGQSGRSEEVAATGTTAGLAAVPLISMRRDLGLDANGKFKAAVNSDGALTDVNDGTLEGSWKVSTAPALDLGANRIGSPGSAHTTQITRADQTSIPYSPIIINEIGNNTGDVNDWIELRNVSDAEVNLKKWELSVITAKGTDTSLVTFPDKDYKLGAGKILLIVNKDPLETPLARGKKFGDFDGGMTAVADQENRGIESDAMFYDAKGKLNALPESGKFLLVLRSESKLGSHEKIIDITGTLFEADTKLYTDIWPLQATPAGHTNVIDGVEDSNGFAAGRAYKRNDAAGGFGEKDWGTVGYTGIGYDRTAGNIDANGGTPGFPNDSLKEKPGDVSGGEVTISEIMVVSNNGRYPQWIELRNSSPTHGVNLNAWRLRIENVGEVDSRRSVTIDLPDDYRLPPNQTMLIATRRGASSDALTPQRVMILWADADAKKALEVDTSRYTMLSTEGFTLKLFGKEQQLTDTPVDTVTIGAKLLTAENIGDSQQRISLIRYYNDGIAAGWGSAKESLQLTRNPSDTYYGASDDIGTPGFYPGSALPVTLSSFLPKRTDAGVVIKWTTQSELNNAGFNILRSATKTGKFVVINPTMIQGAGTTGEKHTYSYTDKTAKPNVVYYYQIEDVSFDGHRQRLTDATRLRGHIGAAGKLTTTWGNLKVQD